VSLSSRLDHLVIAAARLDEGVAWCRETFGFEPTSGGAHPLMGTHNRVFRIDTPAFPSAYFEIIAIDPAAPAPGRTRWFDLDDRELQASLRNGPRLIHYVAATNEAERATAALRGQGIEAGPLLDAQRPTPSGVLRWRISVRDDGRRLFGGALPTLIEWGDVHPCDSLPASGVSLRSLSVAHPDAGKLQRAYDAVGLPFRVIAGPEELAVELQTPAGPLRLSSRHR
jgi:catechol 2,3-dioxygenase-like lactoylglutathione lyase family enzyme